MLYYLCDTEGGSSGSPLVKTTNDDHRCVIALHRGWLKLKGNSYNYGTLMSTIVDDIEGKRPNYCEYYVTTQLPFEIPFMVFLL